MAKRIALLLLAVVFFSGQMCGGPETAPPPDCLELQEVMNVPAGTATGTGFSGIYRGLSAVSDECLLCTRNEIPEMNCDAPTLSGRPWTVTQSNGALMMQDAEFVMTGGVNADGTFLIGGIAAPTRDDGVKTGQVLLLMDGRFSGNLIVATIRWHVTAQASDGRTADGEQLLSVTFQRDE